MTAVFASFLFAPDPPIKSIGFTFAAGVLIDAFIVRLTLVPAVMAIVGEQSGITRIGTRSTCRIPTLRASGLSLRLRSLSPTSQKPSSRRGLLAHSRSDSLGLSGGVGKAAVLQADARPRDSAPAAGISTEIEIGASRTGRGLSRSPSRSTRRTSLVTATGQPAWRLSRRR